MKDKNLELFGCEVKTSSPIFGGEVICEKVKYPEAFEIFWKEYPRLTRGPKTPAIRVWNKLPLKPNLINAIMKGLAFAKTSKKWVEEPDYVPHARTWLNQHRWQDALEEAKQEDISKKQKLKKYWEECTNDQQREYFIKHYGDPKLLGII